MFHPTVGLEASWPAKPLTDAFVGGQVSVVVPPSTAQASGALPPTLPRNTRCYISGNNRTSTRLIGLEAIVKRATGLGGWHWLQVVATGEEIKLQRNALQIIELGPAEESQESSEDDEPQVRDLPPSQPEILDRPRIRRRPRSLSPVPEIFKRPSTGSPSGSGRSSSSAKSTYATAFSEPQPQPAPQPAAAPAPAAAPPAAGPDLSKLDAASLRRYRRVHQLEGVDPAAPKDELASAVARHFRSQMVVDESGTLLAFCAALRRRAGC